MKAVTHATHGSPNEVLSILTVEPPEPADDQVVVLMEATPIHLADIKTIRGEPGFAKGLPWVPGHEGIGRITRVGRNGDRLLLGKRTFMHRQGGMWSDEVCISSDDVIEAPEGDAAQLSLVPINAVTALLLLEASGAGRSDWIIQNAANSSCGLYLIQLAKLRGVRTINVVRRAEALITVKAMGGDINLIDGPDLFERVHHATDRAPIRFALDAVAGGATARLAEAISDGGTVTCYGALSGQPCELPPETAFLRAISLQGFYTRRQLGKHSPARKAILYHSLGEMVANGTLSARIAATYSLQEFLMAVQHAQESGEARNGKIVLVP